MLAEGFSAFAEVQRDKKSTFPASGESPEARKALFQHQGSPRKQEKHFSSVRGVPGGRKADFLTSEEFTEEVFPAYLKEAVGDLPAKLGLIPKEELPLRQFLLLGACRVDLLKGIGMIAGVVNLRGKGHGRGGEVLHLLEMKMQILGLDSQLRHIFFPASGVAGDEVGDELLV